MGEFYAVAALFGFIYAGVMGGWIFDRTGSCGWLYIASCQLGLAAFMVVMVFRPFPKAPQSGVGLAT